MCERRRRRVAARAVATTVCCLLGVGSGAAARTSSDPVGPTLGGPAGLAGSAGGDAADRASPAPAPLALDWCIERAVQRNPEIEEWIARSEAAHERILPAGALEDPRLIYEASNLPVADFDFESTPLSGHQIGLRQKLPFPTLLATRRNAAREASEAVSFELVDRRRRVASAVERAWADLGFAQRAIDITDRNLELLHQLVRIAEARYAVGSGLQQDVLRVQVERTALVQERLARVAEVERATARLASLLDLPSATSFARTTPLDDPAPVPAIDPLYPRAAETNAKLRALRAEVESAELAVRTARLEGLPDVDVGVGYRVRRNVPGDPVEGDDFVSASVTIRLPVHRARWRAHEAERRALLRQTRARLRQHELSLEERLHAAHAELVRSDREAELLRTGLVPQAHQSLEASRSAYEVGRIELASLLDSQVRLLEAQLRAVRARASRRTAFARLEALVGEDLR